MLRNRPASVVMFSVIVMAGHLPAVALPATAEIEAPWPAGHRSETAMTANPEAGTAQEPPASDDHEHANRLINETSPYLLQHAHNPVDWYPWGEDAFAAAREQNKPIFLSVGYSTCYWCHVMERECFENEDVAAIMNEHFINIKVDREERPDVDDIYMAAVQAMTGGGGWPMSVFLEPQELRPFFGGTYFPPEDAGGRPGFKTIMRQLSDAWRNQRPAVLQQAEQIADFIKRQRWSQAEPEPLSAEPVTRAVDGLMMAYDSTHGGYGRAPKFPMSVNLDFLIGVAWGRQDVRQSVMHTMNRMATGGMYDQIGGGFHRYSTDAQWLVPHFEKMLYDNGQLATTYAMAYERTEEPFYAEIIREIFTFIAREMTDEGGGFYSALDAEVRGREGLNYLWTPEEFEAALEDAGLGEHMDFARKAYGLDGQPNFRDPHHPADGPKYVIRLTARPDRLAEQMGLETVEFNERLQTINEALLRVRDQREQPRLDDKILSGWNGLMIAGYADGGRVLGEAEYIETAKQAAEFVLTEMRTDEGGLFRTHRAGESKIDAFAEDYAFMIRGLLALHEASGESRWLDEAVSLAEVMKRRFWDGEHGGYYDTMPDQEDLFVRTKDTYDGATPCANSVMINELLDLHAATDEQRFLDDAAATMRSMSSIINRVPQGPILASLALHRFSANHPEAIGLEAETAVAADEPKKVVGEAVTLWADAARISLAAGDRITVTLTLEIRGEYHINAHDPGPDFLIPLKIELQDGEGLTLDVAYPEGEPYAAPAIATEPMKVHTGTVEIPVRLERTGAITGAPKLAVTWQACTDRACLMPKTVVVPVEISGK